MKAVIPAAGQGTRLFPHTHTKPKAMVRIAGKPILGHILSSLPGDHISEVVVIVGGPMKDQIVRYVDRNYGGEFTLRFPEQEQPKGLGHSIYAGREFLDDEPILIALGDMLFESGYRSFIRAHGSLGEVDGSIGVKRVDEPQHYGIVDVDAETRIRGLVEKPEEPPSNLAISGVYLINATRKLVDALRYLVENDLRGAGDEYQLTDALQRMVEDGCTLSTFEVNDWYDCGRPETLLDANQVLLSRGETDGVTRRNHSVIVPPVDVGDDVSLESCVVGPNVSVDDGASIEHCIVADSIVGREASLSQVNLRSSIIGDNTSILGEADNVNIGDNSELNL